MTEADAHNLTFLARDLADGRAVVNRSGAASIRAALAEVDRLNAENAKLAATCDRLWAEGAPPLAPDLDALAERIARALPAPLDGRSFASTDQRAMHSEYERIKSADPRKDFFTCAHEASKAWLLKVLREALVSSSAATEGSDRA